MRYLLILSFLVFVGCETKTSEPNSSWQGFTAATTATYSTMFSTSETLSFANWAIGNSDTYFTPINAYFNNGNMLLTLDDNTSHSGYATISAEARTDLSFGYGRYEITMKPAPSNGYVSSFFLFWDNQDLNSSWNEIDIEFIQSNDQVQFNHWDRPNSMHEKLIRLEYNASEALHTYSIEYMPSFIKWYVDSTLVHTATTQLPASQTMRIMMNLWRPTATSGTSSWAGDYNSTMLPITSVYSSLKFFPLDAVNTTTPKSCANAPTLEAWGLCVEAFMPKANSDLYWQASQTQLNAFNTMVKSMLEGSCSLVVDTSLKDNYSQTRFDDVESNQSFCLLYENSDTNFDQIVDKGWGSVVVNMQSSKRLAIEIPHPKFDTNTLLEGVVAFKHSGAKILVIAGSDRNASTTQSSCQSGYRLSDVAHNINNAFFEANSAIKNYFETNNSSDYSVVQFHGKALTSCSDTNVFITHGSDANSSKLTNFISTIKLHNSSWTPTTPADNSCLLKGSINVEGRVLNGVTIDEACTKSATISSGHFIHLEQAPSARDGMYWIPLLNSLVN